MLHPSPEEVEAGVAEAKRLDAKVGSLGERAMDPYRSRPFLSRFSAGSNNHAGSRVADPGEAAKKLPVEGYAYVCRGAPGRCPESRVHRRWSARASVRVCEGPVWVVRCSARGLVRM